MRLTAVISAADAGRKIKYFVRGSLHISYAQYCAAKRMNLIRANGSPVHADYLLREGDVISVDLPELGAEKSVLPEPGEVRIVYADDDIAIIDKPAPLACQCTPKQPMGTLENRIVWHYRFLPNFVFRPLNRLDRGTSGLMCIALHAHAYQRLQKQLHTDAFVREYTAIVEGVLAGEGTIDLPIGKENAASVRRIIDFENGRRAVTHYRAAACDQRRTMVRLRLDTGRTHQIRTHLSAIGHPIVGDFLYGTEDPSLSNRFALHSSRIRLIQPITGETIECNSDLPDQLRALIHQNDCK